MESIRLFLIRYTSLAIETFPSSESALIHDGLKGDEIWKKMFWTFAGIKLNVHHNLECYEIDSYAELLQQPVGRNHQLFHILQDRMSLECEFVFVVLNELLLKLWEEEGYLYMYTHADGFVFRKALVVKPCLWSSWLGGLRTVESLWEVHRPFWGHRVTWKKWNKLVKLEPLLYNCGGSMKLV